MFILIVFISSGKRRIESLNLIKERKPISRLNTSLRSCKASSPHLTAPRKTLEKHIYKQKLNNHRDHYKFIFIRFKLLWISPKCWIFCCSKTYDCVKSTLRHATWMDGDSWTIKIYVLFADLSMFLILVDSSCCEKKKTCGILFWDRI